jgi:hypothetical protein
LRPSPVALMNPMLMHAKKTRKTFFEKMLDEFRWAG